MNKSLSKDKNKNHTKNATLKKNKSETKTKTKKVKTKKVIKNNLSGGDGGRTYKFPRGEALFRYKNRIYKKGNNI